MNKKEFKAIRLISGISQEDFAARLNISTGVVSRIERGDSAISPKTRIRVLVEFGSVTDQVKDVARTL